MKRIKRDTHDIPFLWFVFLPVLGVFQKIGVLMGWLVEGSWLNFSLLLIAPIIWAYLVLQRTEHFPFSSLLLMGGIYGLYVAIIDLIYWFVTRAPLGPERKNWSLDDLLNAIVALLVPVFRFAGNVLFGFLIGAITGFIASRIAKRRQIER